MKRAPQWMFGGMWVKKPYITLIGSLDNAHFRMEPKPIQFPKAVTFKTWNDNCHSCAPNPTVKPSSEDLP